MTTRLLATLQASDGRAPATPSPVAGATATTSSLPAELRQRGNSLRGLATLHQAPQVETNP